MKTIESYIISEILRPFLIVTLILAGLFASFSSARFLAEAVTETLGVAAMIELIFLKTLIALEVLVPIALYLAVIIGLGRLHRDQEIIAIRSVGVSTGHIIKAVLLLSIPVAVLSGTISMFGRPWAYERSYIMDARAEAELNTDRFQPGRFYGNEDSGRIVYIQGKDAGSGLMRNIFHYIRDGRYSEIVTAQRAYRRDVDPTQVPQLHLFDGMIYKLRHDGAGDSTIRFSKLVYLTDISKELGYRRKAADTAELLGSDQPYDVAELQWRLSRPLAAVLLALVAIPLSRSSPRQGRGEKTFIAALVFAVYYNLSGLSRTWVEQGVVPPMPGVWWLHGLMLIVVIIMLPEIRRALLRRA
jgi:lipopolysaccharide export system permease protein